MVKATKKKTKRMGRPKGSKTVPKPSVVVYPPRCPHCGSTKSKAQPGIAPQVLDAHGKMVGGERYTSIIWRSRVCTDCDSRYREKTYQYDPGAWK